MSKKFFPDNIPSVSSSMPTIRKEETINPLTFISNTIDTIIDYKKETKRLEAEEKRVFQQAQIIHRQIDAKLEEKIAEIKADLLKFEENIKLCKIKMIDIQNEKNKIYEHINDIINSILFDKSTDIELKKLLINDTLKQFIDRLNSLDSTQSNHIKESTQLANKNNDILLIKHENDEN